MTHQAATPSDPESASASPGGQAGQTSLPRGKACLRCRKRKMRCDGAHPACAQCVRAHKADACAYDDGRGKTRTQALRERIMRLEAELERVRGGRGESASDGVGAHEDSVFLMDPHAPPPSSSASTSASSEGTFGELDFVDFGADGFVGSEIERPTTSLSDPSVSAYTSEPFSFDSPDSSYAGGVHRNRTIRPRDRQSGSVGGGLREPRERMRPSSGVFGYSANHPLVQQAQAQGFASPYQFQHGHSRSSSTGSPSPSSSTVGSIGGHGQNVSASPYSSYTDPLPLEISPFQSPDPAMFASRVPAYASAQLTYALDNTDHASGMSAETETMLIQLVIAHRDQIGFALHSGRLLASLSSADPSRHHPVLKDALLLMGARLARRVCGSAVVSEVVAKMLLKRVQVEMNEALEVAALPPFEQGRIQQEDRVSPPSQGRAQGSEAYDLPALDALQAYVLLSRYLFAESRASEARTQAAAAADLVLQLGLHQLNPDGYRPALTNDSVAGTLCLPPPRDSIALGERVALFWTVFVLDRMVSAALGLPPCIADDEYVETCVDTPWPEEVEEYEQIPMESIQGTMTLRSFFVQQGISSGGFSSLSLLAKAAALYSACARWGVQLPASPPPSIFVATCTPATSSQGHSIPDDPMLVFTRLETCLARLASALLPTHQLGAGLPEGERRKQVVLHTLVHASVARLYIRLARANIGASLEKCARSARAGASLVRTHVDEKDFAVLDPLLGSCWSALADVFGLEAIQAGAANPGNPASAWVPQDHSTLLAALASLQSAASDAQGPNFPGVDSNPGSASPPPLFSPLRAFAPLAPDET